MAKGKTNSLSDSELAVLRDTWEKLSQKSTCSICNERIKKVVSAECGHYFCRPCITKHLGKNKQCPQCQKEICKENLITNKALTVLFEHLQQILTQCERNLPQDVVKELKEKHETPVIPVPSTSAGRRSSTRSVVGQVGKVKEADKTPLLSAVASTKIFDPKILHELKSPTRLPSQFPNEASVISQYSIDPEEKVTCWLDTAKADAVPSQYRPINSGSIVSNSSTLVSASQAKTITAPAARAQEPTEETQQVEESQVDSLITVKRQTRRSTPKTVESDIILDKGPELFQSQSEDYQNIREEKRLKKIEGKVSPPKFKGTGLRKRKSTPVAVEVDTEESSETAEEIGSHRRKKSVPIQYEDEGDEEELDRTIDLDVTVEDFVDKGKSGKSFKQYGNKKMNPEQVEPEKSATREKRSRLSLRVISKSTLIQEVVSPVASPTTTKAPEEVIKSSTPVSVFSRYKKMKSDFKDKKKMVPLDVSTSSGHHQMPAAEKSKNKSPSVGSRELIIESLSDMRTPTTGPQEPGEEVEVENKERSQIDTQCSLIESSLPVESSPKMPHKLIQNYLNTPTTSNSASIISNSPMQSPCAPITVASVISPSTVRLLDKSLHNDGGSEVGGDGKKRKTFSLESNTGDIVGNMSQKLAATPPPLRLPAPPSISKPLQHHNRVHFFKPGKLATCMRHNYKVEFYKLGFLSPSLIAKRLKYLKPKKMVDASVQTSPLLFPNTYRFQDQTTIIPRTTLNHSVLCQTSLNVSTLEPTILAANVPQESPVYTAKPTQREKSPLLFEEQKTLAENENENEEEEEDIIDKSQESVKRHVFEKPRPVVHESCTIDSNDIIPGSLMSQTQLPLKRRMDSSSLSLSPSLPSANTLLSLNESEYNSQVLYNREKSTKKRRVARRLSEVDKEDRPMEPRGKSQSKDSGKVDNSQKAAASNEALCPGELDKSLGVDQPIEEEKENANSLADVIDMNATVYCDETEVDEEMQEFIKSAEKELSVVPSNKHEAPKLAEKLVCEESDDDAEMIEGTPNDKAKTSEVPKPTPPPAISLIFTSLGRSQIAQINNFCKQFPNCSANSSMNPSVTHLVVPHSGNMNTVSTLKFYMSVAKGLWVVSIQWISDCISSGRIIPEEPYEMRNMHGYDGPKKSRLCHGDVFKEIELYCLNGDYSGVSKDQIQDIITIGGGLVIKDAKLPQIRKYRVFVNPTETIDDAQPRNGCIVVMMDWVLESVENHRLASAFNYLPSGISVTQISQAQFDLPKDMLRYDSNESCN